MKPVRIDESVRMHILASMIFDWQFLSAVESVILPEYFPPGPMQHICQQTLAFSQAHKDAPRALIHTEMKRFYEQRFEHRQHYPLCKKVLKRILRHELVNRGALVNIIGRFVKLEAVRQALTKGVDLWEQEKFDELLEQVEKAVRADELMQMMYHEYFSGMEERLRNMTPDGILGNEIYAFLPGLDDLMKGIRKKEILCVLASTNVGKSFFLRHWGKAAIFQGITVCDVTLEMSTDEIASRYDQAFSGLSRETIVRDHDQIIQSVKRVKRIAPDPKLIIKEYPARQCTPGMIRGLLDVLVRRKMAPGLLIVDYVNIMASSRKYRDRWDEVASIVEELKGIGQEYNIPVLTAAQATRAASEKSIVTVRDFGESFKAVGISDVVLSLCQTPEEERQGQMRIFVAKNRRARKYVQIPMKVDLERAIFRFDKVRAKKMADEFNLRRVLESMQR